MSVSDLRASGLRRRTLAVVATAVIVLVLAGAFAAWRQHERRPSEARCENFLKMDRAEQRQVANALFTLPADSEALRVLVEYCHEARFDGSPNMKVKDTLDPLDP